MCGVGVTSSGPRVHGEDDRHSADALSVRGGDERQVRRAVGSEGRRESQVERERAAGAVQRVPASSADSAMWVWAAVVTSRHLQAHAGQAAHDALHVRASGERDAVGTPCPGRC